MEFNDIYTTGTITNDNGILTIRGKIHEVVDNNTITYSAAAPAYRNSSFTGSGLPYFSKEQAFFNTPNVGKVVLQSGNTFTIEIMSPNAYYESLDSPVVKPHLSITFQSNATQRTIKIALTNRIAFRDSKYYCSDTTCRKDVGFYDMPQQYVRSQEQILLDSRYQNVVPDNFWGMRPVMF